MRSEAREVPVVMIAPQWPPIAIGLLTHGAARDHVLGRAARRDKVALSGSRGLSRGEGLRRCACDQRGCNHDSGHNDVLQSDHFGSFRFGLGPHTKPEQRLSHPAVAARRQSTDVLMRQAIG